MKEKSRVYEEVKEGDWEKTPASVKRLVEKQAQVIKELEAQQEELLEKLNRTSKNSSSPPSKDELDVEKKAGKKGSGKKRGGQPGHQGFGRVHKLKSTVCGVGEPRGTTRTSGIWACAVRGV